MKKRVKKRGLSADFIASQKLNFDSMKDLVIIEERINVEQYKFIRNKINWTIRTDTMIKQYRQVYDKRFLFENFQTLPFGY